METEYLVETETKVVCDAGAQETMLHGVWPAKHFGVKDERKLEDLRSQVKMSFSQPSMPHPSPHKHRIVLPPKVFTFKHSTKISSKRWKIYLCFPPWELHQTGKMNCQRRDELCLHVQVDFHLPAEGSFERSPGRLSLPSRRNHGDSDVLPPSLQ